MNAYCRLDDIHNCIAENIPNIICILCYSYKWHRSYINGCEYLECFECKNYIIKNNFLTKELIRKELYFANFSVSLYKDFFYIVKYESNVGVAKIPAFEFCNKNQLLKKN